MSLTAKAGLSGLIAILGALFGYRDATFFAGGVFAVFAGAWYLEVIRQTLGYPAREEM